MTSPTVMSFCAYTCCSKAAIQVAPFLVRMRIDTEGTRFGAASGPRSCTLQKD